MRLEQDVTERFAEEKNSAVLMKALRGRKRFYLIPGVVSKKNALIFSGEYRLCLAHQRILSPGSGSDQRLPTGSHHSKLLWGHNAPWQANDGLGGHLSSSSNRDGKSNNSLTQEDPGNVPDKPGNLPAK